MKNPNSITTTITTTSTATIIEFAYNSANVAKYDFERVQKTYEPAQVEMKGKVITVIVMR